MWPWRHSPKEKLKRWAETYWSHKSSDYKTQHNGKWKKLMSTQREGRLVPTHWWGTPWGWREGAGERETPQVRMGRGSPAPLLTALQGTVLSALLCPPSVPREHASHPATCPRLARLSGTGTPVWCCRLGDSQVRVSHRGTDTQVSATEKRPQKQTHPNMPTWYLTGAKAPGERGRSFQRLTLEQLDNYSFIKLF